MSPTLVHRGALLLALGLLALFAASCGGPPPMPAELEELRRLQESPRTELLRLDPEEEENLNVRELREKALDLLLRADRFHETATRQWERNNLEEAQLLAAQGLLYQRAAENYGRAAEARQRLTTSGHEFQLQIQRRNDYTERLSSEQELIALLGTVLALFERNEALRRQLATVEEQSRTELRAVHAIQEARIEQRTAQGRKADDFASQTFMDANQLLLRAQTRFEDERFEEAFEIAVQAQERFRRAIQEAEPRFLAEQETLLRDGINRQLYEEARRIFFDNAAIDARGLVVTLPDLFDSRGSDLKSNRLYQLDEILGMLREYDRVAILIEGHSDDRVRGDAATALTRTRAERARDYFLQRGVSAERLNTAGFGADNPAFDNRTSEGRRNNNRVEVIFLFN